MFKKQRKKGFTLIELLVVIAIIGLLATLSVVALNNARARARDSRRVSDIKQMQTALELYFNARNQYPEEGTEAGKFRPGHTFLTQAGGTILMAPVPTAPTPADGTICSTDTNNNYVYEVFGTNNSEYCLRYCLGNETGGIDPGIRYATETTINAGATCPHGS